MNNAMAKFEALRLRWCNRAQKLLDKGDTTGAEIIGNNKVQLDEAIRKRQDLFKVADRWRKSGLEPWMKMGKELLMLLTEK